MITAEDFLLNKVRGINYKQPNQKQVEEWLIQFAKIHVTEALKEVEQSIHINATCNICCSGSEIGFNENPIANAYPLERIE